MRETAESGERRRGETKLKEGEKEIAKVRTAGDVQDIKQDPLDFLPIDNSLVPSAHPKFPPFLPIARVISTFYHDFTSDGKLIFPSRVCCNLENLAFLAPSTLFSHLSPSLDPLDLSASIPSTHGLLQPRFSRSMLSLPPSCTFRLQRGDRNER